MERLIIMRHAKSAWNTPAASDFERPLNDRGKRDAPRMGQWLRKNGYVPERIASSPSQRTRETVELLNQSLKLEAESLHWDDRLYHPTLENLLAVAKEQSSDIACLLLVSHNPGVDELLLHLSRDTPPVTKSGKLMTTSALALLHAGDRPFCGEAASCSLEALVRPAEL